MERHGNYTRPRMNRKRRIFHSSFWNDKDYCRIFAIDPFVIAMPCQIQCYRLLCPAIAVFYSRNIHMAFDWQVTLKLIVARVPRVHPFQRMRFKFWEFRMIGMENIAKSTIELFSTTWIGSYFVHYFDLVRCSFLFWIFFPGCTKIILFQWNKMFGISRKFYDVFVPSKGKWKVQLQI